MAYDAQVSLRKGSVRPVYGEVVAPSGGTITIQSGGTFTLYDETGAVVSGFNGVPVSGYNAGALVTPQIWYVLNTSTLNPNNLYSSVYAGLFSFQALGSDGITRTFNIDIQISILPYVELIATYNPNELEGYTNSALYNLRLAIADVDMTQPTFQDSELQAFLNKYDQNIYLSASVALTINATNSAYLANTVKIGSFGSGAVEVYKALIERAKWYRDNAIVVPSVVSPDQIFVPNFARQGSGPGNMTNRTW